MSGDVAGVPTAPGGFSEKLEGAMSYARQVLDTYTHGPGLDRGILGDTIDALNDCIQACVVDTDADLSEGDLADMVKCVRLCLHCTDICTATAAVLSRPAEYDANVVRPLVESCIAICKSCGDECERHAHMHDHCRVCAAACRQCEQACRKFLGAIA
jgi:hypothetical protein